MKVNLGTIEVSDEERRALNAFFGMRGFASREMIRTMVLETVGNYLGRMVDDNETDDED